MRQFRALARPQQYVISIPPLFLAYGKSGVTFARPQRVMYPECVVVPSTCGTWEITSFRIGNEEFFDRPATAEIFSELAVGIRMPPGTRLGPDTEWRVAVTAPPRPKPAHWSLWRKPGHTKHRLRVAPTPQRRAFRRGLYMQKGTWPRWLPRPRPPGFFMSMIGACP
jgi:hypothetical protein